MMAARPPNAVLRTRQLIPPLTARTPSGQLVRVWDFKQKKNLVIALLDAGCSRDVNFVERLMTRAVQLAEQEAVALIVYSSAPPLLLVSPPAEVILAADLTGHAARVFLGESAFGPAGQERSGVFVADRYGELYAQWVVAGDAPLPGVDELLGGLKQIELACEECGVSDWPASE